MDLSKLGDHWLHTHLTEKHHTLCSNRKLYPSKETQESGCCCSKCQFKIISLSGSQLRERTYWSGRNLAKYERWGSYWMVEPCFVDTIRILLIHAWTELRQDITIFLIEWQAHLAGYTTHFHLRGFSFPFKYLKIFVHGSLCLYSIAAILILSFWVFSCEKNCVSQCLHLNLCIQSINYYISHYFNFENKRQLSTCVNLAAHN